jgi:hypothetical protein
MVTNQEKQETLAFIDSRTPAELDEIAAHLIEELIAKNEKLSREVDFLRGLMASYVEKHEALAEGHA